MPFKYENAAPTVDVTTIEHFVVYPGIPAIDVYLRDGRQRPDGSITSLALRTVRLGREQTSALMDTVPGGRDSLYQVIKTALYNAMTKAGELPDGKIA